MRPRLMFASLLVTGVGFAGAGFVSTATAGDGLGRTPLPTIEPGAKGEQCVADQRRCAGEEIAAAPVPIAILLFSAPGRCETT